MSRISRPALGVGITVVLAVVAGVIAFVVLGSSSKASEVNLTSARLVPADSGFYFALNSDLSSEQWVAAFDLAKRMGEKDPEGQLKDDPAGIDWEKDVEPFLGGNLAVFVRTIDVTNADFQGGIVIKCKDGKRCLEVFESQSGGDFEDAQYAGVTYHAGSGGFFSVYAALIDGHLVLTYDEDSMHAVIDVSQGKEKSLATVSDFQQLRDQLTKHFLGFFYVSTGDLAGDFFLNDPAIRKALDSSGTGDMVFKPMAMVFGAEKRGFEYHAASVSDPGVVSPLLAPRTSRFAKVVPGDTAVFVSTTNVAKTWHDSIDAARAQIDEAIAKEGEYRTLDDALRAAGSEIGLRDVSEVIDLLTGETAVAAWFPGGSKDNAEGVLLFEIQDEAKARGVLDRIFAAEAKGAPRNEQAGSVKLTVIKNADGDEVAYAITDGYAAVGSKAAVAATVGRKDAPLSELGIYQRATADQKLGSFAFFNLQKLTQLSEGGVPPVLDEATKALQGLIINAVNDGGLARVSGLVTIKE